MHLAIAEHQPKRTCLTYKIDTGNDGNLMPFEFSKFYFK